MTEKCYTSVHRKMGRRAAYSTCRIKGRRDSDHRLAVDKKDCIRSQDAFGRPDRTILQNGTPGRPPLALYCLPEVGIGFDKPVQTSRPRIALGKCVRGYESHLPI